MNPPAQAPAGANTSRSRISLDLSDSVSLLLDHVSSITGASKSQIINSALIDALPELLERADSLQKRSSALAQSHTQKKR